MVKIKEKIENREDQIQKKEVPSLNLNELLTPYQQLMKTLQNPNLTPQTSPIINEFLNSFDDNIWVGEKNIRICKGYTRESQFKLDNYVQFNSCLFDVCFRTENYQTDEELNQLFIKMLKIPDFLAKSEKDLKLRHLVQLLLLTKSNHISFTRLDKQAIQTKNHQDETTIQINTSLYFSYLVDFLNGFLNRNNKKYIICTDAIIPFLQFKQVFKKEKVKYYSIGNRTKPINNNN